MSNSTNLTPVITAQFLVTVAGQAGYWTKVTSPKRQYGETKYSDGSTGQVLHYYGFAENDSITISKPYQPGQDTALITWLKGNDTSRVAPFTVTVKPVTVDITGQPLANGLTFTFTGCQLKSYTLPAEVDRTANAVEMITVEIDYLTWSSA